jgi:inhibitor of KinA
MVHLHTKPEYTLFFYGFQPGFMYLGGLDKKLVQPRKDKPSAVVNSGSVAVGGAQTGIYPLASPGGWHIIGHCPLILFDPQLPEPCIAKPGDVIKFRAVEKNEYQEILDSLRDHKMLINH